ncbi:hypothetical protein [Jeotgalibacillus terrae]|uniref:Uncharacterized protein n=1 Tax=Jeotgalibacillus terrae TaxID=587735 RepID=A0ABW5ZM57_9BACL|nr:hypothetical protein [Jeotgalibacillus terrae]MBM7578242.1 hypothetical protein [Jeotgalibacillus terrae]
MSHSNEMDYPGYRFTEREYLNLVELVKKEHEYMRDGGTDYRRATAKYGNNAVLLLGKDFPFLDKSVLRNALTRHNMPKDSDRLDDVAKFVHTLARIVYYESRVPQNVTDHVEKNMEGFSGKIKLISPVTKSEQKAKAKKEPEHIQNSKPEHVLKTTEITEKDFEPMIEEFKKEKKKHLRRLARGGFL